MSIRTETLEQWVVLGRTKSDRRIVCTACHSEPAWLSIADACTATGLSSAEICGMVESGEIHSSQTCEGHLLICDTSLLTIPKKVEDVDFYGGGVTPDEKPGEMQ